MGPPNVSDLLPVVDPSPSDHDHNIPLTSHVALLFKSNNRTKDICLCLFICLVYFNDLTDSKYKLIVCRLFGAT